MQTSRVLLSTLTLAATAAAQVPLIPTLPHQRTFDVLVGDQNFDGVYRLVDWNQDGDYDDAGEVVVYYDSAFGSVPLGTPSGIAQLANGTALVCDVTSDVIVALRDQNGDGDANDPGEHWVYFDNNNASGVGMFSMQGICVDLLDRVFVANGNNGQGGTDGIFLLEDLDQDGDVLDAGEVRSYCDIPNSGGSTGHSNPFDVAVGPDNNLYYTDNGLNGPITKGLYRLTDLNLDGDCNDVGEWNLYWQPSSGATAPFLGAVLFDQTGAILIADYGSNQVVRGRDLNADDFIDPSEQTVFFQTGGSIFYDAAMRDDGAVLVSDYTSPGLIFTLQDQNNDGDAMDAGESSTSYTAAGAARPRSMTLMRAPLLEMSPPIVQIGNTTNCLVRTEQAFDLAAVFFSAAPAAPFALPPWGNGEIDPFTAAVLGFGIADANAQFVLPFAIPNNPSVVATYGLQVWSGHDFHFFLSNGSALVVTP